MDSSSVSNSRLLMIILQIKSYQNRMNSLEAKSKEYIKEKALLLIGMRERNKSMKNQLKETAFSGCFKILRYLLRVQLIHWVKMRRWIRGIKRALGLFNSIRNWLITHLGTILAYNSKMMKMMMKMMMTNPDKKVNIDA